jgi:hypothetical protein
MIEEIKKLIELQQQLAKQAVDIYKQEVDEIIRSKTTNDNKIQLTLDYMLSFCFDDQMLLLYKKLCRYYWDLNPQATADYVNYYREMWDEESEKGKTKGENDKEIGE